LLFYTFLVLLGGILEFISIGLVVPFLAVVGNPQAVFQYELISALASFFFIKSSEAIIIVIGILFILAAFLSAFLRIGVNYAGLKVVAGIGFDISSKVYENLLAMPYEDHIEYNPSDLVSKVTIRVDRSVASINSAVQFINSAVLSIFIITALFCISAKSTIFIALVFTTSYVLYAYIFKSFLLVSGSKVSQNYKNVLVSLNEGFSSIRDVILDGSQELYIKKFNRSYLDQKIIENKIIVISTIPRYLFEALGILVLTGICIVYTIYQSNGSISAPLGLAILGSFALGAQKLLPCLQRIYASWADYRTYSTDLREIIMIMTPLHNVSTSLPPLLTIPVKILSNFKSKITFNNISFSYRSSPGIEILSNVSFAISKGERIGIVGKTGAGKSTLTDVLMGLLPPSSGKVLVDSVDIYNKQTPENLYRWRDQIAHVPQTVYLADSTIAENIAFGIPANDIDMNRVHLCAKRASLLEFIESTQNGFNTLVGERGVKISGGQVQRIAIARCLYKDASVLIFDEATSALDSTTETSIIQTIRGLRPDLTIIIIAHRLSTVAHCDRILELSHGNIVKDLPPVEYFQMDLKNL